MDVENAANAVKAANRPRPTRSGFKDVCSELWRAFGLLNHDPYIARISMIQEAQRQIGIQREMQAEQRAEDQAREEQRMLMLAREMAREMFAEAERRRVS